MLSREDNEMLTRVGPGTPAGELLRRYWQPVAVATELTEESPTKLVRILGENLVLFLDGSGRVGLLEDRCPHRGASLSYGRVEVRGIACAYHGWLFDTKGNCLETPAEPAESKFHLTVKHRAYPVQEFIGLYWAYLGPQPAPLIPRYDIWVRNGIRRIGVYPRLDCNWLQAMENDLDPAHLMILHQNTMITRKRKDASSTTRGLTSEVAGFEFNEIPYGIMKKRVYKNGEVDEHPHIFPNSHRQANTTPIKVPIDDTHTMIFFVFLEPSEDGETANSEGKGHTEHYIESIELVKDPVNALYPFTKFRMDSTLAQDHMAFETAGPIADRENERLATSDHGIVMYREILKREIEKVQRGVDPMGVIRDLHHGVIDTGLEDTLKELPPHRFRRPFGVRVS